MKAYQAVSVSTSPFLLVRRAFFGFLKKKIDKTSSGSIVEKIFFNRQVDLSLDYSIIRERIFD